MAEAGFPWTITEETRDELTSSERAAPSPDVLVIDEDGSVAAYLDSWTSDPAHLSLVAFVRPAFGAAASAHGSFATGGVGHRVGGGHPISPLVLRLSN